MIIVLIASSYDDDDQDRSRLKLFTNYVLDKEDKNSLKSLNKIFYFKFISVANKKKLNK